MQTKTAYHLNKVGIEEYMRSTPIVQIISTKILIEKSFSIFRDFSFSGHQYVKLISTQIVRKVTGSDRYSRHRFFINDYENPGNIIGFDLISKPGERRYQSDRSVVTTKTPATYDLTEIDFQSYMTAAGGYEIYCGMIPCVEIKIDHDKKMMYFMTDKEYKHFYHLNESMDFIRTTHKDKSYKLAWARAVITEMKIVIEGYVPSKTKPGAFERTVLEFNRGGSHVF